VFSERQEVKVRGIEGYYTSVTAPLLKIRFTMLTPLMSSI
jgi:hypothetical protein